MKAGNSAYLPAQSAYPFEGVDFLGPSTQINPSFSPEALNTDTIQGHLTKRTGYADFGGAVDGVVLAIIEFKDIGGTSHLVCVTTTHEYKWSGSAWTKITYKDAGAAEHARTGTEDNGLDWLVTTGITSTGAIETWLIITNGVDKPRYWDGTLATFYEYSTATVANHGAALVYTDFSTMKTISTLNSYIVLGNVTTTANEPNVVVWSDTQSLVDFQSVPSNAGAVLLPDVVVSILKILPLGDRLMIYAEDSIHQMIHTGDTQIFAFEKVINNTRLLSGRAIVDVGPFHFFMSQENIYLFDGTRGVRRVADRISPRYRDILQSDLKTRAFAFLDQPKNCIFFVIPTSSTLSTVLKMEFDIFDVQSNRWNIQSFNDRVTSMGFFTNPENPGWDDIDSTVTWSSYAGSWNRASAAKGFPLKILGHSVKTSIIDDTVFTDDGIAVSSSWESMDFTVPREFLSSFGRWSEIEFESRGTSITVSVSYDEGSSYVVVGTCTLTSSFKVFRMFIDNSSRTLRIKFTNTSTEGGFEVRWYRVWFTHSGSDD